MVRWSTIGPIGRALIFAFALSTVAGVTAALPQEQERDPKNLKNPVPVTPESLAAGAQGYTKVCAVCHGATGHGDGKLAAATAAYGVRPSNLTDDVWDRGSSDGEIFVVIRDGIGPDFNMPGFKTRLSDAEIWNVVSYVKGLGGKK
jgi:high-affinity iron transporter